MLKSEYSEGKIIITYKNAKKEYFSFLIGHIFIRNKYSAKKYKTCRYRGHTGWKRAPD